MAPDASNIPCERCGAATAFAAQISPLGDQAGARLYQCVMCNRLTWIPWRPWDADRAPARPSGNNAIGR